MRLQNKIAVITGGNSGIGLATAKEFKAQGARVIILGRNAEAVANAAVTRVIVARDEAFFDQSIDRHAD